MQEEGSDLNVRADGARYKGSEYSGFEDDSVGSAERVSEKADKNRHIEIESCVSGMLGKDSRQETFQGGKTNIQA